MAASGLSQTQALHGLRPTRMAGAPPAAGGLPLVRAALPAVLGVLAGALLAPFLHSWQLSEGGGAASGTEAASPGGALLQRTVALYPLLSRRQLPPWGVRFDLTDTGAIVVTGVERELTAATGLAVGDVVVSLAGVAIAGDHDPLSALDEAEEALQARSEGSGIGGAVTLVVTPSGSPPLPPPPLPTAPATTQPSPPPSGWRWSRHPCDPGRLILNTPESPRDAAALDRYLRFTTILTMIFATFIQTPPQLNPYRGISQVSETACATSVIENAVEIFKRCGVVAVTSVVPKVLAEQRWEQIQTDLEPFLQSRRAIQEALLEAAAGHRSYNRYKTALGRLWDSGALAEEPALRSGYALRLRCLCYFCAVLCGFYAKDDDW